MLGYLAKRCQDPDAVTVADAAMVKATGVSDQAIEDAIYICLIFSTITRLADAFDWQTQTPAQAAARMLLKFGYKL